MEKFTAKEYVEAFIANQNNKDEWKADYRDGLSVKNICLNDTVDVYFDHPVHPGDDMNSYIVDSGQSMLLTDDDNYSTQYEI